jgi:hypothetical protein
MNAELGITSAQFGLLIGVFFWGRFIFEVPSNIFLHKIGARIWIARILVRVGHSSDSHRSCTHGAAVVRCQVPARGCRGNLHPTAITVNTLRLLCHPFGIQWKDRSGTAIDRPEPKQSEGGPHLQSMRILSGFCGAALLCALTTPAALKAQGDGHDNQRSDQKTVQRYHDTKQNDDHEWNAREDQAYHAWSQETHRKSDDFSKLNSRDQQSYWNWRHDHSDAQLKIEIK